ncbi:ferredoxin [Actinosynnema sp. NPDC020468]|uniref:ferredoxin n=1 Tax=Actinosynnema sp. NPDC020468 TaxID=3154488 RepID=UPI0033ED929D
MSDWTIEVDRRICTGSGRCAAGAPGLFRLEQGHGTPVRNAVEASDLVLDTAESCPAEAIVVRDDDGSVLAPQL